MTIPSYRFTAEDQKKAQEALRAIGYRKNTKGKTWEEIYGPEYAALKRAQVSAGVHRLQTPEARAKGAATRLQHYADGTLVHHQTGRTLPKEQRQRIARTRRERYGTRASINKQVRFTSRYKQWRTRIFERDSYTCQECGSNTAIARKRVFLEVHHKVELWQLIGDQTFEEAMSDPAIWDDDDNAVTLCKPCHRKIPVGPFWER